MIPSLVPTSEPDKRRESHGLLLGSYQLRAYPVAA